MKVFSDVRGDLNDALWLHSASRDDFPRHIQSQSIWHNRKDAISWLATVYEKNRRRLEEKTWQLQEERLYRSTEKSEWIADMVFS